MSHSQQVDFGGENYRLIGESMFMWMSTGRMERQTSAIMQWFQGRTMGWMLQHAPMYCDDSMISCRVTTGLQELNAQLEYEIDGFDYTFDAELRRIYISFYLA